MIENKQQYKEYIYQDRVAMGWLHKSLWREWLKGNRESVVLMKYCIYLRKFEYISYSFHHNKTLINKIKVSCC